MTIQDVGSHVAQRLEEPVQSGQRQSESLRQIIRTEIDSGQLVLNEARHVVQRSQAAENFDVAIGCGIELTDALVARELARLRVLLVASRTYLNTHPALAHPLELMRHRGLQRRSLRSGRLIPLGAAAVFRRCLRPIGTDRP